VQKFATNLFDHKFLGSLEYYIIKFISFHKCSRMKQKPKTSDFLSLYSYSCTQSIEHTFNFYTGYRGLRVKITVRTPLALPNPREKLNDLLPWKVFYCESCYLLLWKPQVKCMNRKVNNGFKCKTVTHNILISPSYCLHSSSGVCV